MTKQYQYSAWLFYIRSTYALVHKISMQNTMVLSESVHEYACLSDADTGMASKISNNEHEDASSSQCVIVHKFKSYCIYSVTLVGSHKLSSSDIK